MNDSPINIFCKSCGAPAKFDIARQIYHCRYCGSETGIREALEEKRGFRELHRENLKREKRNYPLVSCSCTGCGATVIFPEGEALSDCAFCGRSLVRNEYLGVEGFPELLIPFRLTEEEARARLLDWCARHPGRREARELRRHAGELKGFYLPYEVVKGPTSCTVCRDSRPYYCRGWLDGSFVNTSKQLNNLLLDGTEPYDLNDLKEFDFSYLAGHRVKIRDIDDTETAKRVRDEIAADYEPYLSRIMETRSITVNPDTGGLVQLGAVLPAYYLRAGNTLAAVNGQTGKVAVQEAKDRYLPPWWLRPIGWTALVSAVVFGLTRLFGAEMMGSFYITGLMAVFLLIVLFTAYHDKYGGDGRKKLRRRIFTSDDSRPVVAQPEFYEQIDGRTQSAELRFTTPLRLLKMLGIAFGVVFLPLILAFIFNGFSAAGLHIGGAAVWLCIMVPVVPVYFVKFGRMELYEHPLIWYRTPEGKRKRWRGERAERKPLPQRIKEHWSSAILIGAAIALVILIINVTLVLHWDNF